VSSVFAGLILLRGTRYAANLRVPVERRFYFAALHAESSHLHLVVDAADKGDGPVRLVIAEITRSVKASFKAGRERAGNKALCCQIGAVQVPPCHNRSADEDLASNSCGHRLAKLTQNIDTGACDGAADRGQERPALGGTAQSLVRDDVRLCWAILVFERTIGYLLK
jgi:hypothetical protein